MRNIIIFCIAAFYSDLKLGKPNIDLLQVCLCTNKSHLNVLILKDMCCKEHQVFVIIIVVVVLKVPLFNFIKRINLDKKPDK